MTYHSLFSVSLHKKLSVFLIFGVFILILLGGYVKAVGAGLGCPDWPLCYGQIFPVDRVNSFHFWVEYIHRLVAVSIGLITLYVFLSANRLRKDNPELFLPALALLSLIIIQAIIGGLTVIFTLDPLAVTTHLGLAIIVYTITLYNYVLTKNLT